MAVRTANTGANAWNTNAAWVGSVQPTAADDVIIPASATVTIGNGVTAVARSVVVQSGGTLSFFNSSTARLNIGDATAGASNKALDFQSGSAIINGASAVITFQSTSATQQTITTNGISLVGIVISGVGSSYILGDALTSVAGLTVSSGTFNSGNYNITMPAFSFGNNIARTITLGSSALSLTGQSPWAGTAVTNLTMTSNTAVATVSNASPVISLTTTAFNWNGLSFVSTTPNTLTMTLPTTGAATIRNLTVAPGLSKVGQLTLQGNLTLTTLTLTSNSDANKILVVSHLAGTARTITANSVVITNTVDFIDITGAGAATWTVAGTGATYLGDGQGNSGITFTTPAAQTISSGNWDNAANWTSRIPLPQDDVTVTGSSAVTLNMLRAGKSLDFSGYSGTLTLTSSGGTYWFFGGVTLGASMSYGANPNTFNINLAGRGNHTITSNGKEFMMAGSNQSVVIMAPGGTYTLADNFSLRNVANSFTFGVNAGTFNSANYNMNIGRLVTASGLTRTVNLGTSTITLRIISASPITITTAGLTLSATNATFTIAEATATARTLELGGSWIGTLNYTVAGSTGQLNITTAAIISTLNFSDANNARTLQITAAITLVCFNFNVVGTAGKLMTVKSSSTALAFLGKPFGGTLYNASQNYIAYEYIQVNQPQSLWLGPNSSASNSPSILATAPTYQHIQTASSYSAAGTSITATFALTPTAGRLLIGYFASSNSQGTFTPPAGWTQVVTNNTSAIAYIFYKIADGTETSVTFSQTTNRTLYAQAVEYSGFSGTPTLDVTDNNGNGISTTSLSTTATTGPTNTGQPALAVAMLASPTSLAATTGITNGFIEDRTLTNASSQFKGAVKELTSLAAVSTTFSWTTGRSGTAVGLAVFKNVPLPTNGNFFQFFN